MDIKKRLRKVRLLRRDWIGDGVLTLIAGVVLVAAVFVPWVNEDRPGWVNYSLTKPAGIYGVLQTHWGAPALGLACAVLALGLVMTITRPRRWSAALGAAVVACGIAVAGVASDAAAHIGFMSPGVGMYLTMLAGVLLVPIGAAAALVAWFIARGMASQGAAAGGLPPKVPPAPESAPPS